MIDVEKDRLYTADEVRILLDINRIGLGKETIRERLKKGWSEEEALNGKKVII